MTLPISIHQVARVSNVRAFSTTIIPCARQYKSVVNRQLKKPINYKEGDSKPWYLHVPKEIPQYPAYPYGEARVFKRSDRGLFGGQERGSGHQISSMGNKHRRSWLPNVITKTLWSESLNKTVKLKLTARVLRTITKEGGLDNYLTKDKSARIKELGIFGWQLRYDILKAREEKNKPANYTSVKLEDGSVAKVYYKGSYKGQPIQLTVGRRTLLRKLFPVVKYHTTGELHYSKFGVEHAKTSFEELLKECEKYDVDLSDSVLKSTTATAE